MHKNIQKLRQLIDELEQDIDTDSALNFKQNFDALEIPDIIAAIVDFLQPQLLPHEASVYWKLFSDSVIKTGQQYTRVSVRGLTKGVVKSASGQSEKLSYGTVQKALQGLEEKGAVKKAGETNREGTLYKIFLPEEISCCQRLMKERTEQHRDPVDVGAELDYYNVRENRQIVFERDNYICHYCGKQLTRFTATLDHIQPISEGGDNSSENLITACLHCNSRKGRRPVMDIINQQE